MLSCYNDYMKRKMLPIGESNFRNLITDGYLYVDKTEYIYRLITSLKYYFLSRPRRFGKSLLISTLEEIFKGNKELFKGLWIYNSDYDWPIHPILILDFNEMEADNPENLKIGIVKSLLEIGESYNIELEDESPKYMLIDLVKALHKKYNRNVVILIDEYDKPIIKHLGAGKERLEIAKENREILKDFYGTLKGASVIERLRFLLLTGVSKFSKAGIFSELNNLFDLTMDASNATILGITDDEVDSYFGCYLKEYADIMGKSYEDVREEVRNYYNGYRFSHADVKVYNPYSLVSFFKKKEFSNYWFESGTPTFFVNLIKERDYYLPDMEEYSVRSTVFSSYDLENLDVTAILFQTGYLTIKDYNPETDRYTLSYPNVEVKRSFIDFILDHFTQKRASNLYTQLYDHLFSGDIDKFISVMQTIFATITYDEGSKLNEANFHSLFYVILSAGSVPARSQVLNFSGRIDMVVEIKDKVYIFEFKCDQEASKAIDQIKRNEYYKGYLHQNKKIHLVGINFDSVKRNVSEYLVENVEL